MVLSNVALVWRRFVDFYTPYLEVLIPYLAIKRQQANTQNVPNQERTTLRRALPGWQILFIAIGGVIGVTIFSTHGEIIRLAGPGGLLISTLFVAVTMICVMECIGQLVILWPVSNAMVEYVRTFVDEDFAIVVGIAYWYAMSCIFSSMIIIAADFAKDAIPSPVGRDLLFYVVVPLCLVLINIFGVEYYGFIEGIGGAAKLLMVISGIFYMIVKAPQAGTINLDDGFKNQASMADSKFEAICIAIPLIAYGYVGTEIVAVTAFEAINRKSLRFPVRWISYIIASLYFLSALMQSFLVKFTNHDLQSVDGIKDVPPDALVKRASTRDFQPVIVIAAQLYGSPAAAHYFNGCIIYFCISAANTALYVASRTLFGLTRNLNKNANVPFFVKPLRHFGTITPRQVPLFSLMLSAIAFYWQVPVQLGKKIEITDMLSIVGTTASIGIVIVWASQCIAYIRYYNWLRKFRDSNLVELPGQYNRWEPNAEKYEWHAHRTVLTNFKLVPAVIGLLGCFCIVFVLSTANWWKNGHVTATKLWTAYAGPIVLFAIFVLLKIYSRRWWVVLAADNETFAQVTGNLERNSNLRDIPGVLPQTVALDNGSSQESTATATIKESSVEVKSGP